MDRKEEDTATPLTRMNSNDKRTSRNILENWTTYRNNIHTDLLSVNGDDPWDGIKSLQFVEFSNLPNVSDTFFDDHVIVSTPILQTRSVLPTGTRQTELENALRHVSLSTIEAEKVQENINKNLENDNTGSQERFEIKKKKCTVVNPFSFDVREQEKQQQKLQRIEKIFEEEKNMRVFRAKPVPKCIKLQLPHAKVEDNDQQVPSRSINDKNQISEKIVRLSRVKVTPVMPNLLTEVRARQRKLFDEMVREKAKILEEKKQLEIELMRKKEKEEIAQFRKQIVHKAQPVRKYKNITREIAKRPMTDPITPICLKRRRYV